MDMDKKRDMDKNKDRDVDMPKMVFVALQIFPTVLPARSQ
jgi:hypothetical protein